MLYHHPPSQELRQTFEDLGFDKKSETKDRIGQSCACCNKIPMSNASQKQIKLLALIVFVVTATLVALSASQREETAKEEQRLTSFGPGGAHAMETTVPAKSTIEHSPTYYVPVTAQNTNTAYMMPLQAVRPAEPAPQYLALPVSDGMGGVRIKRIVGR